MKHGFETMTVVCLLVFGGLLVQACGSPDDSNEKGGAKTTIASADLCAAEFDALEKTCPSGNDRAESVEICKGQQHDYTGQGCDDDYDAWLECTAGSGYDCAKDTGCESAQTGYFTCMSQAVQRTGCVRLGPQDTTRCSADASKPFAFSCVNKAPTSCTQVVTEGAGIWCCPQI